MKSITARISTITLITAVFVQSALPASAQQQEVDLRSPGFFDTDISINTVVRFGINALFFVAILAALFFLIWGGVKWIISGGDKEKVSGARSTIIAAIIGLILVILSYVILNFVLQLFGLGGINELDVPKLIDKQTEINVRQ